MTWLNKPKAVSEPQRSTPSDLTNNDATRTVPIQLPASPSVQEDHPRLKQSKEETTAEKLFYGPQKLLPANVEFRACTKEDIPQLKHLTGLLLPIPYPESFYREIITDPLTNSITLLAVWHDDPAMKAKQKGRLVGAIRCRLLAQIPGSIPIEEKSYNKPMLYLSTLVLLSPYRSHGIASHMLQTLTRNAVEDYGVASVGAHVWEANTDALEWYRKRGFFEVGQEMGYYRRLNPQGAVVMQRKVSVMDLTGNRG